MATVAIRGNDYEMAKASVLALSPLLSAMGVTEDDSAKLATLSEKDREKYGQKLLKRLSEPTRHYQIAFSLARLFPTIPDDILSYRQWWNEDGDRLNLDFTLDLEVEELALLIQAAIAEFVSPQQEAPAPTPPAQRSKPAGFAPATPPAKPKTPPPVIRPETLPAPIHTALTAAELETFEGLTEEGLTQLRNLPSYLPLLESSGVTENLYNYIHAHT
jgi:hypothetical protein